MLTFVFFFRNCARKPPGPTYIIHLIDSQLYASNKCVYIRYEITTRFINVGSMNGPRIQEWSSGSIIYGAVRSIARFDLAKYIQESIKHGCSDG